MKKQYSINVKFFVLDIYNLTQEMLIDPDYFGFTNISDTARLGTDDFLFCPLDVLAPNEGVVENANEYLFFDDVHPTTTFHKALADRAFEKIDGRIAEIECDGFNNKKWKKSKRKNHLKW